MRTKDLDNGSFWLLVEPSPTLRALSVAGLIIVAIGYLYIGYILLAWKKETIAARVGPSIQKFPSTLPGHYQRKHFQRRSNGVSRFTRSATSINPLPLSSGNEDSDVGILTLHRVVYNFCVGLWRNHSDARKVGHVWMKIVDLILQLLMLHQTLEVGPLVIVCTLIVVWNALAVVALINLPSPPSQIGEAFVDSISDLLVAVVFPVLVLLYCLTTFEFDRESQRQSVDLFPRWSFQNAARVHADPEQMTTIYKSLEGLRFQSVAICVARLGNNAALLISLRRLVNLLRGQVSCDVESNTKSSIYPRKHPLALLLIAIALGTIVYVAGSVRRSEQACLPFPSCTMYAYRWRLSSPDDPAANTGATKAMWNCPCRVLIDVDLAPTKFSVWKDPPHATDTVSNLAASGDLEILQVINRQLPELPETLRRCNNLKHIALVFTHITSLPSWATEFTNLEFLHIEGKSRTLSLASLPPELFTMMNKLTFVHLGAHTMLPKLPDVAGLTNLRSITMAQLEALDALPAGFAKLRRLEIVLALMIPKLKTFPDLSRAQQSLKALVVDASPLCCKGFLQTACDLTSRTCGFRETKRDDPLTCLSVGISATSATLELFQTFNSMVCVMPPPGPPRGPPPISGDQVNAHNDSSPHSPGMPLESERDATLERDMQQCDGVLFRECKRMTGSNSGICFCDRYMPISCMDDPNTIELRRLQI